jgi:hypothetical protein
MLVGSDSSDNPTRPFRWYRGKSQCVFTDDEQSIIVGRDIAWRHFWSQLYLVSGSVYIYMSTIREFDFHDVDAVAAGISRLPYHTVEEIKNCI